MIFLSSLPLVVQSPLFLKIFTFFALGMCILSFWIKRSAWIWGSFLCFSCVFAYLAHIVSWIAFIPILALFLTELLLHRAKDKKHRFLFFVCVALLSLGLALHRLPGFHNWLLIGPTQLSPDSPPFRLYLNFDKPFIGICALMMGLPLAQGKGALKRAFKYASIPTVCGVAILAALAIVMEQIKWDPKFPSTFWLFFIDNFIFVSIIEEAFWRGFMQRQSFLLFGGNTKSIRAGILAILTTSLIFAALHYPWAPSFPFLLLVLGAGLIYGTIYQCTQMLEASIFCHFTFNIVHFLFFSYPMLAH